VSDIWYSTLGHSYFCEAPLRPSLVFSLDWLELFHTCFMNGASTKFSFVESMEQFLEMQTFERLPLFHKAFEYAYFNWLTVSELAEQQLLLSLDAPGTNIAAPGTLEGQCIACFYRKPLAQESEGLLRSASDCTDKNKDPQLPSEDSMDFENDNCCVDDAMKDDRFYVAIDGNSQHRRYAHVSQGQGVKHRHHTFADTSSLRIPLLSKRREPHVWGFAESSLQEPATQSLFVPIDEPPQPGPTSREVIDNAPNSAQLAGIASQSLLQIPPNVDTSFPDSGIYTLQSDRRGCPHIFAADRGNVHSGFKHEKPRTMKPFDETGCVGMICRHDIPLRIGDLFRGENQETILLVLRSVARQLPTDAKIYFQYDLACKFSSFLQISDPELAGRTSISLNAFHAHCHGFKCQLQYGPLQTEGLARTDAEGVERHWSTKRHLVPVGRISAPQARHDLLHAHNLHIAKRRRTDMPNHLERRFKRITKEAAEQERMIIEAATKSGQSRNDFVNHVRRKLRDNKERFFDPGKLAEALITQRHRHYPLRYIFTELCRLQPSKNGFLRPDGKWTNINLDRIVKEGSTLINYIRNGKLKLYEWHEGEPLWQKYFSEVCMVRLHSLRNNLLIELSSRMLERHQAYSKKEGTKHTTQLFRTINDRSMKLPGLVADHNNFLVYMVDKCPSAFPQTRKQEWAMNIDDLSFDALEKSAGEILFVQEKRFIDFWGEGVDWGWEPNELKAMTCVVKLDRSLEELVLLRTEMRRLGNFLLNNFKFFVDPDSPLRARRNWQEYINNTCNCMQAFIQHGKLFQLELLAKTLTGKLLSQLYYCPS
jgi:Kyakuja-Dileera-Zisupton transposase